MDEYIYEKKTRNVTKLNDFPIRDNLFGSGETKEQVHSIFSEDKVIYVYNECLIAIVDLKQGITGYILVNVKE